MSGLHGRVASKKPHVEMETVQPSRQELGCIETTAGECEYGTFGCSRSGAIVSVCRQRWSVVEVPGGVGGCIRPTNLPKMCAGVSGRTDAVLKANCDHTK